MKLIVYSTKLKSRLDRDEVWLVPDVPSKAALLRLPVIRFFAVDRRYETEADYDWQEVVNSFVHGR